MSKFDLIIFDIDGTLTRSKLPLDEEMAGLLCQLLDQYQVAIISGASYEQFQWQILDPLKCGSRGMEKLTLLPVDGTVYCNFKDGWLCHSDEPFSNVEKNQIKSAFENIFQKSGVEAPKQVYGELVEDRGAQFNFSALGQKAPIELKDVWDQDNHKRQLMIAVLKQALPGYSLRIGGTTSIEVTKEGIDKAYGLKKLLAQLGISKEKAIYFGDKLFKGGNDEPVLGLGIECRSVAGPEMVKEAIRALLASNYE